MSSSGRTAPSRRGGCSRRRFCFGANGGPGRESLQAVSTKVCWDRQRDLPGQPAGIRRWPAPQVSHTEKAASLLRLAALDRYEPRGNRTPNPLIKSQLLCLIELAAHGTDSLYLVRQTVSNRRAFQGQGDQPRDEPDSPYVGNDAIIGRSGEVSVEESTLLDRYTNQHHRPGLCLPPGGF